MAARPLLPAEAPPRTPPALRATEAATATEVVVAVRPRAPWHAGPVAATGAELATVSLGVMWWSPTPYDVRTMPLDVLVAFALGALACLTVPALRRVLTPERFRRRAAERAARAAFTALGVERTRDRTGLFVYVALFEREAVLRPDSGIPPRLVEQGLVGARAGVKRAVQRLDFPAFIAALSELGPPLSQALPKKPDDVNELCDDVA
jgi:uncharacterized membrane protein